MRTFLICIFFINDWIIEIMVWVGSGIENFGWRDIIIELKIRFNCQWRDFDKPNDQCSHTFICILYSYENMNILGYTYISYYTKYNTMLKTTLNLFRNKKIFLMITQTTFPVKRKTFSLLAIFHADCVKVSWVIFFWYFCGKFIDADK